MPEHEKPPKGDEKPPAPPQVGTPTGAPLPPSVLTGFRIGMYLLGFGLVAVVVVSEMRGHDHGATAYMGHAVILGFATMFIVLALAGLTKTVTFAQGMAGAWRKRKGGSE